MSPKQVHRLLEPLKFFGILALAVGWTAIFISIMLNPWFSFTKNALSDLGALGQKYAFIFNSGLFIAGVLASLYAAFLLYISPGRLFSPASSIFLLAAIHLILIAVFPEKTYPHLFVSLEFFILAGVSILFFGLSFLAQREVKLGAFFTALAIGGFVLAAIIPWPSIAAVETFSICLMTIWAALMLRNHLKQNT